MASTIKKSLSQSNPISIKFLQLSEIRPDQTNPRLHSKKQIRQIAKSIETFGFNVPILINASNKIIAGHGRFLACELLGWAEVPTICLDHLTPSQVQAFMIADNKLCENAVWDDTLLAQQFKELSKLNLDFSIDITGFEMGDIDIRIEGLDATSIDDDEDTNCIPDASDKPAISKLGDIWELGNHRVVCGSSLEESSYNLLMQGKTAAMIFTDPPFNVKVDGHVMGNGRIKHREFAMASGEMSSEQFTTFLSRAFTLMKDNSSSGSIHFICMDWRHIKELVSAAEPVFDEFKNLCVWAKDNGGMGSLYRSRHELIFVYKHGKESHRNNVQLGVFGRYRSNVWNYPGVNSFSKSSSEGNLLAMHPTVKPVALVADAILDCSGRNDIILDPFLGSGTTIIAAERTGRIVYGIELDPIYVDTIIRRWQQYTGNTATHSLSGKAFNELEAAGSVKMDADSASRKRKRKAKATRGGSHDE